MIVCYLYQFNECIVTAEPQKEHPILRPMEFLHMNNQ